ncbi:hypothetical protein [Nocardioides jejuensis]|uniref:Uncharacterized protein n=1 Tax=Nocardioides jejuensis TaxID=2502782 RepID=A0A4R1BVH5_9ACTN|nr:hypothetical protein [Nocardioides jejuensis]TCJ21984.1 hypothetical protein EPD65_13860 [Nocardioides jejuensis]
MTCATVPPPPIPPALISARAACRILATAGLAREQARLALACGLAGPPTPVGGMLGYDSEAVGALARRRWADATAWLERSVLVLREHRGVDPRAGWNPDDLAARPLPLGRSALIWIVVRARNGQPTPCLVTVAGFVAGGFDVVGARPEAGGAVLEMAQAGPWFEALAGRRLPGPSGGREWSWWPRTTPDEHFTDVHRRTAVRKRPATRSG